MKNVRCDKATTTALAAMTLMLAMGVCAAEERPTAPWPGPSGDYVFVEAETFDVRDGGWSVSPSHRNKRAGKASGLNFLNGSAGGDGHATKEIEVPSDGDYTLWVRFSQVSAKALGPFGVSLKQGGRSATTHTFGQEYNGKPGAASRYPEFAWESIPLTLKRGTTTISLSKDGSKSAGSDVRQVDCLLLTTDAEYEPDYRDFAPQTYLRIRLHKSDPEKVYFHGFLDHMRAPWYDHIAIGSKGMRMSVRVGGSELISPGQATPWVNFSRALYSDSDTNINFQATMVYHKPRASSSAYAIDFATAPDDSAVVHTIERDGPGAGVMVRVPPDLTDGQLPEADFDYAQANFALTQKLPEPAFGRRPTKFPLLMAMKANSRNTPGTRSTELKVLSYLGVNGIRGELEPGDPDAGILWGLTHATIFNYRGPGRYSEPQVDRIEAAIQRKGEELKHDPLSKRYSIVSLMDEATADKLPAMAGNPSYEQAFTQWLKDQGLSPADLGVSGWDQVKLTPDRDTPHPALYRNSQRYRAWSIARFFGVNNEIARKHMPQGISATQNFSDGAVYMANMYSQGNDYYTWFRNDALGVAGSEDWTNNGSTPQLCGWNVALLRSATREHGQPIYMLVITSFSRPPLDVKLKAYSDIAQGAKTLGLFSYSPTYQGHEPGWYMEAPKYAAVAELAREIGAAEDQLLEAMPKPAEAVIIYSRDADIWSVGDDNAQGIERMHTYLALRHSQAAVDVVDEQDVINHELSDRKVAYLFGQQLDQRCVPVLADWVKAGGTLVLCPGAGGHDELNRPAPALDQALGIKRQALQQLQGYNNASKFLTRTLKSQGKIQIVDGPSIDLFSQRQDITATGDDQVLAEFDDGKPAYVVRTVGQGRVVMVGFLPAVSYIWDALDDFNGRVAEPVTPLASVSAGMKAMGNTDATIELRDHSWAQPASSFNDALRDLIRWPIASADIDQPVSCDTPLVEATFMDGPSGWAVPLANYSGQAIESLTVTLDFGGTAAPIIHSAHHGVLQAEPAGPGKFRVQLPLESTDILYGPPLSSQ